MTVSIWKIESGDDAAGCQSGRRQYREKRQSPRYRIEAPAILRVQGRTGPFLVTLLDVSSSGLRLSSPAAFAEGAKVTIKCLGAEVTGEVRYARPVDDGSFHIGVLACQRSSRERGTGPGPIVAPRGCLNGAPS